MKREEAFPPVHVFRRLCVRDWTKSFAARVLGCVLEYLRCSVSKTTFLDKDAKCGRGE